jgi:hypothetical protein
MTQLERLQEALAAGQDMPVLTGIEFEALTAEVLASDLSEFDQNEILACARYKGRGFGVDYSQGLKTCPTT